MPATLGSSLAAAMALRLRARARAAAGSSFFLLTVLSGLAFLPMRPWREGVVERGREAKGVVDGVCRMVWRTGEAAGRTI